MWPLHMTNREQLSTNIQLLKTYPAEPVWPQGQQACRVDGPCHQAAEPAGLRQKGVRHCFSIFDLKDLSIVSFPIHLHGNINQIRRVRHIF